MNDDKDEIQRCAKKYKFLVDEQVTYQIEIFSENNKSLNDLEIKFFPSEFKHLTSIGKLKDLKNSSEKIFLKANEIYKKTDKDDDNEKETFNLEDINKSTWFFDDTIKPDNKTDEEISDEIKEAKEQHKVLKSELLDRLSALENLYDIFDKLEDKNNNITLKLYHWDRNAHPSDRPHNSTINADFLLEFYDANNLEKPFTDFFIIRKTDDFIGMSIFHSEFTYSEDTGKFQEIAGINRRVPELEILSLREHQKGQEAWKTLLSATPERIKECENKALQAIQYVEENKEKFEKEALYTACFNELKARRTEIIKQEGKKIRNEYKINDRKSHYQRFLLEILPEKCPDDNDLKEIRSRLETARKDARPESELMIDNEIKAIDNLLKLREMLNQLSQFREKGEYDDYSLQIKNVIDICNEKEMCSYVLSLIDKQKRNSDEELDAFFAEEENRLKSILNVIIKSEDTPETKIMTMSDVIHESGKKFFFSSIVSGRAVTLENNIKSKLLHIYEEVFDKIRNGMKHISDIISEKISSFRRTEKPPDKSEQAEKSELTDNEEKSEEDELIVLDVYNMSVKNQNGYIEFINTSKAMDGIELQTGLLFEETALQERSRQPEQVQIEIKRKSENLEYGD